jgi:hypothetical protein
MLIATMLLLGAAGCGDDTTNNNNNGMEDMAMPDKPDLAMEETPDMAVACVQNPMTHVEIINACTTAQSYDKMPFYPTLAPNGVLPSLP